MQLLANAKQMQGFDQTAMTSFGIAGLLLMENAGRAVVDELEHVQRSVNGKSVLIMCGKGNNGGDGFVIARHCLNRGAIVIVALLAKRSDVKGDAATNLKTLLRMAKASPRSLTVHEIPSVRALKRLHDADIVVDAIFGTGFTGEVRGVHKAAIEHINRLAGFVTSVDISSGVDATTGVVANVAVNASLTVTMGLAKVGHFVGAGREKSGQVEVVDIGIPSLLFKPSLTQVYRVTDKDVRAILPKRALTAHKYSVGKVFVLAGSRDFTGAPFMTAQSALRAGAGAVILGVPKSIHPILARKLTEVILVPLDETEKGTVAESALDRIKEKIGWADVVALGPGMGRQTETDSLILAVVAGTQKPLIIDADGLNALAGRASVLRRRKSPTILTPHSGELSRLLGMPVSSIERDRVASAHESARLLHSILVLKGSPSVTGDPDGPAYVNSTGNPGMATIGSGDVLTGMIAGLLAQGVNPLAATWASVFLHGRAGDHAARKLGQRSLMAMDILDSISAASRELEVG